MEQNSEQKTIEAISDFVELTGKAVLEIGSGDGRLTSWLAGPPKRLAAIEPDAECVKRAREAIPGAEFHVGSGERLPFPDASFDVILFSLSLHHQDSRVALREADRVLRDNGALLVLEPLNEGGIEAVCKVLHNEDREKQEAQQAIRESGWVLHRSEIICADWVFETPEELYRWVFGYYGKPIDAVLARQMAEQPEVDLQTLPIALREVQELQLLKKGAAVE